MLRQPAQDKKTRARFLIIEILLIVLTPNRDERGRGVESLLIPIGL